MAGKARSSLLSLAIIAVLVFGAVSPTIAYADDGNPPDTPPTEASSACTANGECPSSEGDAVATSDDPVAAAEATSAPTEVSVEATSPPTEVPVEATSAPDEAPAEAGSEGNISSEETAAPPATEEAAPVAEEGAPAPDTSVLDQVPDNTTVTVLDAQGQSQPLATQESADAIATSDPIWCPEGQAPTPGANGCTDSFSSFDALLTFLSGNANYQGSGTIYVQQGTYNGGESSIDFDSPAYDLSNINNSDLTIQGGWNTSNNTVDPASTSNFTIPISIGTSANPWGGSLTINNITINKTDGTGLTLHSQNDITISHVTVTNSVNGAGAELNAGDRVSINNSKFDRNKTAGAMIKAGGSVALSESSFSNPADGRRQVIGVDIVSGGGVALENVVANENREVGANINATGQVAIANSVFSGTKAIKGSGASTTFWGYGLQVVTPNSIALASVTANDNFLWGASLNAGEDVNIADSFFNGNTTESPGFIDDTGLLVKSGGKVNLDNVQANDNRLIGATIEANGDVFITNSTFTNNRGVTLDANGTPTFHGYGLNVVTPGDIALTNVDARNNSLFGAHLEGGNIDISGNLSGTGTVRGSFFSNEFSGSTTDPAQQGRGLEIISNGNVVISGDVFLENNQTFGANIQAAGTVSLDGVTVTNNGLDGVDVETNCSTVFVNAGTYSNNGGFGLSVTNSALAQSGSPVFANNGAGDIFHDPGSCVFPTGGTTGGTGNGNGTGSITTDPAPIAPQNSSRQVAVQPATSFVSGRNGSFTGPASNSFLASSGTVNSNSHISFFVGNYAYTYSDSGLHIIVFSPFSDSLAMGGS